MRFAVLVSLTLLFGVSSALPQDPSALASDYEDARGKAFGQATRLTYQTTALEPNGVLREDAVTFWLGSDWAAWRSGDSSPVVIADLLAKRRLTLAPDTDTFEDTSLYAEARRRLDIYTQLSQGGQLDQIAFGPTGTFDRIWLEAAMGVAARPAGFELSDTELGFTAQYNGEGIAEIEFPAPPPPPVFTSPPERLGFHQAPRVDTCPIALLDDAHFQIERFVVALAHSAPLHPDILERIAGQYLIPCSLSFTVFSPDSPQGRSETWTLLDAETVDAPFSSDRRAQFPRADLLGESLMVAAQAARDELGQAPDEAKFYEDMLIAQAQGDIAGAYLLTFQETHHFGPCPEQAIGSARLACAETIGLAQVGIGNASFERASEGVIAMREGDPARAVDRLSRFIDRDDRAGAAARILVANELVAWGREGLASRPDLDPAQLLSEALAIDPLAPDTYWHLGRRYLEAGAPHAAWVLFDLGRSLPGRAPTPSLAQIDDVERVLAQIAPRLVGGSSPESAQVLDGLK